MAGLTMPRLRRLALSGTPAICHQGDSALVLPEICRQYGDEPIFFYLDAHHIARLGPDRWPLPVADRFPLWDELKVIADRNQLDRVVVDDVHAFGRREKGWNRVRIVNLRNALRRVRYSRVLGDQWVAQLQLGEQGPIP